MDTPIPPEFDLEMSPEAFRKLGYRAIDLIAENLERLQSRQEPARRAVPQALREELLHAPLPQTGSDPAELIEYVAQNVLTLPEDKATEVLELVDALEQDEDVQRVFHTLV